MYFAWITPGGTRTDFLAPTYNLTDTWSFGEGALTHQTEQRPFLDGVKHLDTLVDPAVTTLEFLLKADTREELFALQRTVTEMFNPKYGEGILKWVDEDGTEYAQYCIADALPFYPPGEQRGETWQVVRITLYASDPYWYSGEEHIEYISMTSLPMFPFGFPFMVGKTSNVREITNAGLVDTPCTITIYGSVTDPVVEKVATGDALTFDITANTGDRIYITTEDGNKRVRFWSSTGGDANAFPYLSINSVFFKLAPGANIIKVSCNTSAAGALVAIQWRDKYLRVL